MQVRMVGASDFLKRYIPKPGGWDVYGYIHGKTPPEVPLKVALDHPAVRRRVLMDLHDMQYVEEGDLSLAIVWDRLTDARLFVAKDYARIMKSYIRADDQLGEMSLLSSTYLRRLEVNRQKREIRLPLIMGLANFIKIDIDPRDEAGLPSFLLQLATQPNDSLGFPIQQGEAFSNEMRAEDLFGVAILETARRHSEYGFEGRGNNHSYLTIGISLREGEAFVGIGGDTRLEHLWETALAPDNYLFAWRLHPAILTGLSA